MKKDSKTKLECLTISKELIAANIDWTDRAILAYIGFRINHPSINWTFSQADIVTALKIDKSKVSRFFKTLT